MMGSWQQRTMVRTCVALVVLFTLQAYLWIAFVAVETQGPTTVSGAGPRGVVDVWTGDMSKQSLTIFTILRDLSATTQPSQKAEDEQRQRIELLHTYNAIGSWLRLPGVEVILFGSEESCRVAVEADKLLKSKPRCLPIPCINAEFNTPQYDCLFGRAANVSTTEFIMYANSDIVFFPDLLQALSYVQTLHEDFLLVGQRTDLNFPQKIDFHDSRWQQNFKTMALEYGQDHGNTGLDFFLYRRRHARAMPPFLVGRIRWDNWLLAQYIGSKTAVAVDVTGVVLAVHLNHMKIGESHLRGGTDYNIELSARSSMVDPKKIGTIESCDLQLVPDEGTASSGRGGCPKCSLKKVAQSLDVMLYKQHTNYSVIVATVDAGYLNFASNWACSLKRLGISNYLFHAVDDTIFFGLQELGHPVIKYLSQTSVDYAASGKSDGVVYGSISYQSIMNTRTEFITKIVQKGYNVLLSDVDIVFLRNPFDFFDPEVDIQGGAHKETKITGGFIYTRATASSYKLWSKVLTQHRELFAKMQTMQKFDIHSYTEQELLNTALLGSKPEQIRWARIPQQIVADGKRFFIDKETQKKGEWPAVIHNNYIIGAENKLQRFKNVSLWLIDDNLQCRGFKHSLPPTVSSQDPSFTIKVLAYDRPAALSRLLESLRRAQIPPKQSIQLDIFIDYPSPEDEANPDIGTNRTLCVALARAMKWKYGDKKIVVRTKHMGLVNQWLSSWFPVTASEVALILEDDNIVSPLFFTWLKEALRHYYNNPHAHDPRLVGIALQNQHMIAGRYPKKPGELLDAETTLYKYQLLSTWGPVFFGNHWSNFLTWYADRSADPNFLPLFSNLITNKWFLARGGGRSVWSAWFIRYCAERGLYMLYTNYPNGEALVVNNRDSGINYKETKGPNSAMVTNLEDKTAFPPLKDIPLYDFHFNQVTENPTVLEGRGLYTDIFNTFTM